MANATGATPAAGGSSAVPSVQNIDIRVPKNENKKLAIMRFNGSMGIDFVKWTHVKMERENNQVTFKGFNEDMPKFGAGSEYGREQREEARRKKYGIISKKYKPEDQPWTLQVGGKAGKKFRGVRDGGVAENASYYVFTQAPDGVFEAFPVQEQYSFQAIHNYKALSYEEAEEEFNSRNRTFNLFNVMYRKRMKKNDEDGEDEDEEEGEGKGKGKGKKKKSAKDSRFGDELDDMMQSSDDSSDEDGEDDDDDFDGKKKSKKKGKKVVKPKKKRKQGSDDEALEDSDDGDGEGRELDYISSDDESDVDMDTKDELKGVAEEDALRKLLNSDEEDEDEDKQDDENKEDKEEEDGEEASKEKIPKEEKDEKKKKKDKKKNKDKKPRKEEYGSSSDSGGESSESELEKAKPSPKMKSSSANSSRSATPTKPGSFQAETLSESKRKGLSEAVLAQATKKPRLDMSSSSAAANASGPSAASSSNANEGVNEESVRRYLSRKPMTTTELLQKFKSKRTGLTSEQLVPHIAQILKKINPVKQTIKGKMYLSIRG